MTDLAAPSHSDYDVLHIKCDGPVIVETDVIYRELPADGVWRIMTNDEYVHLVVMRWSEQ